MDRRIIRLIGLLALVVCVVWMPALQRPQPMPSIRSLDLSLLGVLLGLVTIYYGRALAVGIRPSRGAWNLLAALVLAPTAAVAVVSWEAAIAAALALSAWIPFTLTWALPLARVRGIRSPWGMASLVLLCGLVPPAWVGLVAGVIVLILATAQDPMWRAGGIAITVASVVVIGAATILTWSARRAVRRAVAESGGSA